MTSSLTCATPQVGFFSNKKIKYADFSNMFFDKTNPKCKPKHLCTHLIK
jgi:hypothetical protein